MTTKVIVEANHGWPVRVTIKDQLGGFGDDKTIKVTTKIVKANTKEEFFVWDTRDISIHEIQPDEEDFKDNK